MLKEGKLSHLIKELKQHNGKENPKAAKKGETFEKDEVTESQKIQAVLSTAHEMLKPPVKGGVITLKSSRLVPLECAMVFGPERNLSTTKQIVEDRVKVAINLEYPEQTVMIGSTLSEEGRNKLCDLLQRNLEIFAWKPADMTEAEEAFKQMKQLIAELPMLTMSVEREELIGIKRSGDKLYINSDSLGICQQAPKEILSSTLNHSNYGPGNTIGAIKTRSAMEAIEVEHRIRRICNTLQTQSVSQGADINKLHRPFLEGPGKVKFLILAMDYFTKWIEAKPMATITGNQVKKFMLDNIFCKFEHLREIISDNGKQFRDNPFKYWCEKLSIFQHFASVKHPQTNGLVERANHSLGEGIKARLDEGSKNWIEELSHVLWAHHTMIKSSNGDTPFSLTYRTEAIIPVEIGMPTLRTAEVDLIHKNKALEINLNLLEERREQAALREAKSKAKIKRYYNFKVQNTSFKLGDLVYRNNDASRAEDTGKLGPKWEGPYEVTEALGKCTYKLTDLDGKQLPRTWNIRNLKKCYIYKM
uniref:Reverse transcriptase domain-containing protein n=1 Tax=Tanacetum cinerariifolium TaxID=118510 RepID=A0A6L2MPR6_TANCI|nr:reverse transcriptase domain-containing protein [Tanacetum cinerariifolium]